MELKLGTLEEVEAIPLQHEDEETYLLRITYEQALREAVPDLDEATVLVLASMVVKKARYGIVYEEDIEKIINKVNTDIINFYSAEK